MDLLSTSQMRLNTSSFYEFRVYHLRYCSTQGRTHLPHQKHRRNNDAGSALKTKKYRAPQHKIWSPGWLDPGICAPLTTPKLIYVSSSKNVHASPDS